MKRFTILAIAAVAILAGTSCKHPHTCTCTDGTYSDYTTVVMTKKKAKEYCAAHQASYVSSVTCTVD